jgi:hypothetical protein
MTEGVVFGYEVIEERGPAGDPYQLARLKAVALMAQQHAKRPGREHLPGRSFCLAVPELTAQRWHQS